jgi:cytochrome c-type biogenesis protein CcmH
MISRQQNTASPQPTPSSPSLIKDGGEGWGEGTTLRRNTFLTQRLTQIVHALLARRGKPWHLTPTLSPKGRGSKGAALFVIVFALAFTANLATAQAIDPLPFRDHAEELRFQHLTSELRCLVCQDENLADSNADFARDLRHKVFELMQQGKSDAQIKQYLADRYSDFVLYDPPVNHRTWLLWFGPLLILIAGAAVVVNTIRKRSRTGAPAAPAENGDDW